MSTPTTSPARTPAAERSRFVAAHEDAADFYRRQLLGPEGDGPRRYLTDRGFEALLHDTRWTVGYAPPGWTRLADHLTDLGYRDETLLAGGLTRLSRRGTPIDCFRDRITFGIRDHDRALVGFTARCSPDAPAHVPKYLNTPATTLYDKSQVLFGLGEATNRSGTGSGTGGSSGGSSGSSSSSDTVVLTEGPLDAIAVDLSVHTQDPQPPRALALCGTAITENHRNALTRLEATEVILALDNDAAGARARENAYQVLHGTAHITAIDPIDGSDLAEAHWRNGPGAVHNILARTRPAIDVIIDAHLASWPNRTDNAETAIACLRSLAKLVNELQPDDVARQAVRLRDSIKLPANVVTRELTEAVTMR